MRTELVHAVNTGKMTLEQAEAKEKELNAPKTDAAKPAKAAKGK